MSGAHNLTAELPLLWGGLGRGCTVDGVAVGEFRIQIRHTVLTNGTPMVTFVSAFWGKMMHLISIFSLYRP